MSEIRARQKLSTRIPRLARHQILVGACWGSLCLSGLLAGGSLAWAEAVRTDQQVIKVQSVPQSWPVDGVVEAVRQASITAQVPGRVVEVRVEPGQAVKKGDVLVRLDVREASETLAALEAQSVNAKAAYERTRRLVEQKFMSPAALDKAKADLDAISAQRNAAQAQQNHGTVLAPFNGWVAARPVNLGDQALPGTPLVTVYDPSSLRVVAQVPQHQMGPLQTVKQAQVEMVDATGAVRLMASSAMTVVPAADAGTHASQVRVNLPAGTAQVVPGTYARIHFLTGTTRKMTVPTQAVVRRGEVAAVYVQPVGGGARPVLRQLRLGEKQANGEIEVLAGLVEGEVVLTDPVAAVLSLKSSGKP